jgi:hypothetical protein
VPLQAALLRNATHLDVIAIAQFRHAARHLSARRGVAVGRSLIVESLMRRS